MRWRGGGVPPGGDAGHHEGAAIRKPDRDEVALADAARKQGLDFFIHSDAPPGSGLGSSSTMVVTLIGLLKHYHRLPLTDYEMAQIAFKIERGD